MLHPEHNIISHLINEPSSKHKRATPLLVRFQFLEGLKGLNDPFPATDGARK